MRRLLRKIHKWVFVFVGLAMFLWVGTGVFMSLPLGIHWQETQVTNKADYSTIKTTVADAITIVKSSTPSVTHILSVQLQRHKQRIVYVITSDKNNKYMVDAVSGEYFIFSGDDAEQLVRQVFNLNQVVLDNRLIQQHSFSYPYGVLPVYKIRFKEAESVSYYINPAAAAVHRSTWLMRVRAIAGILHDFGPARKIFGNDTVRWALLFFVAAIALIGTIAGLFLTLPVRKHK